MSALICRLFRWDSVMTFDLNIFRKLSGQLLAVFSSFIISFCSITAHAGEVALQVHKGGEQKSVGYGVIYSDNIASLRNFRWGVGYSYLDQIKAQWNDEETLFKNNTLDAFAAYRYYPKTYNAFLRAFSFEIQAGASLSLTENKFTFENFPDQEVVFSEKNDINFMTAFVTQYQLSRQTQIQLGYKYYPDFSDFGSQRSIFIGVTYQFGRRLGY